MKAEIFVQALRERRRSILWWSLGLGALVAVNVAFYPSIRDDEAINEYVRDLPEALRGLLAGGELDITSPAGYLNSQIFALLAPLVLLIFAIGAGSGAVAGEEEKGTLDFILAHPVRRSTYVLQRSLALVALVSALTIVLFVTVAGFSLLVDLEIGVGRLIAASVSAGLLAALFGMFALAGGSLRTGRAQAIALAVGLVVLSWLLDGFGQSVDVLEPFRPLSPYYQAMGRNPLREGIAVGPWVLLVAVTSLLVAVAALGLERRDLRQ